MADRLQSTLWSRRLRDGGACPVEQASWVNHIEDSPIRASALLELNRAPTLRTAEILLEQNQGALDQELVRLIDDIRGPHHLAIEHLDRLIERGQTGIRLTTGWRIVIAGRPNVGKSRLLNALAGYQRAIVDPTPGTTRDLVTALTAFDGWPVELVDTAGVRETDDVVERSGIDRTLRQTDTADLVLQLLDRSVPLREEDQRLIGRWERSLLVVTKADLPGAWEPPDPAWRERPFCLVSAERGDGLEGLIARIVASLVPAVPEQGAGVPFQPKHLDRLNQARGWLQRGDHHRAIQNLEAMLSDSGFEEC